MLRSQWMHIFWAILYNLFVLLPDLNKSLHESCANKQSYQSQFMNSPLRNPEFWSAWWSPHTDSYWQSVQICSLIKNIGAAHLFEPSLEKYSAVLPERIRVGGVRSLHHTALGYGDNPDERHCHETLLYRSASDGNLLP